MPTKTADAPLDSVWQLPTKTEWRPDDQVPSAVNLIRERWFVQGFHIRVAAIVNEF